MRQEITLPFLRGAQGWAWPLIGAAGRLGGWLVVAPGTPVGGRSLGARCFPPIGGCEWRYSTLSPWLGACSSEVDSDCEKSKSAVTCALTLPWPTTGSRDVQNALHVLFSSCCWYIKLLQIDHAVFAIGLLREQLAAFIQNTHAAGGQLRARWRPTKCTMPAICVRSKPTARVEIDDHRGRRLLLLAEKTILIGQGQVHAGICTADRPWMERVSSPSRARW